jgi:hypothetical protein
MCAPKMMWQHKKYFAIPPETAFYMQLQQNYATWKLEKVCNAHLHPNADEFSFCIEPFHDADTRN